MDSGIEKSFLSSCHHIIYGKIKLRVPIPPPHFTIIWNYKIADAGSIQRARESFNWQYAFESRTIYEKVQVFREVLINVRTNFVLLKL